MRYDFGCESKTNQDSPDCDVMLPRNAGVPEGILAQSRGRMHEDEFFRLVISSGDQYKGRGETIRAEEMYTLGIVHWSKGNDPRLLARALSERGDVYNIQGRWREAITDLEHSRKIYRQLNVTVAKGRVENILGLNYAMRGRIKKAQSYIKRALRSFEHSDMVLDSGIAQMNLGVVSSLLGDFDAAISSYHRARSHFEEVGDQARLAYLHYKIGMAFLAKERFDEAVRHFDRTAQLGDETYGTLLRGLAQFGKASLLFEKGDVEASWILANQSLAAFSLQQHKAHIAEVYLLKGKIHRLMKRHEFAEWYFRTSLMINLEMENQYGIAESYRHLGILHKLSGRISPARDALAKSLRVFQAIGAERDAACAAKELRSMGEHETYETRRTSQE